MHLVGLQRRLSASNWRLRPNAPMFSHFFQVEQPRQIPISTFLRSHRRGCCGDFAALRCPSNPKSTPEVAVSVFHKPRCHPTGLLFFLHPLRPQLENLTAQSRGRTSPSAPLAVFCQVTNTLKATTSTRAYVVEFCATALNLKNCHADLTHRAASRVY